MTKAWAFTDLIGGPDDPAVTVRARLEMLSNEAGGRSTALFGKYRPNHNFGDAENRTMYVGQIEIPKAEPIAPGSVREVDVLFIGAPGLRELLVPGRRWRIQEGPKLVAFAEVIEVLAEA